MIFAEELTKFDTSVVMWGLCSGENKFKAANNVQIVIIIVFILEIEWRDLNSAGKFEDINCWLVKNWAFSFFVWCVFVINVVVSNERVIWADEAAINVRTGGAGGVLLRFALRILRESVFLTAGGRAQG